MPQTLEFLVSPEAAALRMLERKPAYVAHVELAAGGYVEMDAASRDAAYNLAQTIIKSWDGAIGVSVRKVKGDGSLSHGGRLYMENPGHSSFTRPRPDQIGTYHHLRPDGTTSPKVRKRFRIKSVGFSIATAYYTKDGDPDGPFETEASSFIWLFRDGPNKCHIWLGHPLRPRQDPQEG